MNKVLDIGLMLLRLTRMVSQNIWVFLIEMEKLIAGKNLVKKN